MKWVMLVWRRELVFTAGFCCPATGFMRESGLAAVPSKTRVDIPAEYVHDLPASSLQRWTCVFVFVFLQVDLEPEGKVYIHLSLTGSFIDGKAAAIKASYHRRTRAGPHRAVSPEGFL